MWIAEALAAALITLTAADGKTVQVNPDQIVAIRPPRTTDHFVAGAKCLIFTSDGRFISASLECEEITAMLKK